MDKKLKIAIFGYGKMGKEIENLAIIKNHTISLIIDNQEYINNNEIKFDNIDVAIDFSTPESVISNIKFCFDKDIPIVVGTTGWYSEIENIKNECISRNQSFFYASNFSIGVNIYFEINRILAKIMNNYNEYNATIEEIHHVNKKDAPSGTAIFLANDIIKNIDFKDNWVNRKTSNKNELEIISVRENNITGTHIVNYSSEIDEIEIKHTAKNRKGFAFGALMAAEWITDKKGFFEMKDMLNFKL